MKKKILSIILLAAVTISGVQSISVMAQEGSRKTNLEYDINSNKSIFDNTIAIKVDNGINHGYAGFYFEEINGKLYLGTNQSGNPMLSDNITVKFLTQGGSVEISRRFIMGTSLENFKNAIRKIDLKYGDSIQLIPERSSDSIKIYGFMTNNADNYDYSLGISKDLAETRAFKLTHDGMVVNRYYPI